MPTKSANCTGDRIVTVWAGLDASDVAGWHTSRAMLARLTPDSLPHPADRREQFIWRAVVRGDIIRGSVGVKTGQGHL